ncbi:lipoate--protein ligase family protein [Sulfurirhabdus autotrophica]|uniref:Lipoate-protein ligase A n=1 Tax=Sulfurirhabdus autotrophica TaxID=1706046 RepID=A0A4R3XUY0_9PROT|nr:lipoate--protein ligase family protein [Sulfurirhabdus autotrophica]TCV82561.1 lipoate-protein ligase A [Sulfurirhabdus autotrophica]
MRSAARWIDIGLVAPATFHATYAGLADHQVANAAPILLWGRTTEHICLGQHQNLMAELAQPLEVPVLQRPLGGGTVWVDEFQYCFVLIVPLELLPGRPQEWFEWGLAPMLATYRRFGMEVELHAQDVWLDGRKIGGSGAATIGNCAVLASSFLMHFPIAHFVQCIACPTEGFRNWMAEALSVAMTDWQSHQSVPDESVLVKVFWDSLQAGLKWDFIQSALSADEVLARDAVLPELAELDASNGKRLVPDGIKLNARTFLTEKHDGTNWVRVLTVDGKFSRIMLSRVLSAEQLEKLVLSSPTIEALQAELILMMPLGEAEYWAALIMNTAFISA